MTHDEIDTMWQKAMRQSIKEGEMFTRYQFAQLVAAKATEEANAKANASWTLMCKKMVAIEREALAQTQEPIAMLFGSLPVYDRTTPPQRTWVGLTDEERIEVDRLALSRVQAVQMTEAKLKEKNT
jgi:hypothetical protein